MKPVEITNKQVLAQVINQDEYAVGALIHICNNVGFNGTDSRFGTSLAKQYLSKGRLTTKQIDAIRKFIPKYHGQISTLNPLPIKKLKKRINKKNAVKSTKNVVLKGETLYISFPFDRQTLGQVKLLSGRKWNNIDKQWTAPISVETVESLIDYDFSLDKALRLWMKKQNTTKKDNIKKIKGLRADLFDYQTEGINFIESKNGRAIIGDEMGLGKTLQALGWMQHKKKADIFPALVVCPSSLKLNWARESLKFTDLEPAVVSGREDKKVTLFPGGGSPKVYIINYDIIHEGFLNEEGKKDYRLHGWLKSMGFKTVIYDECHYTKNSKAGRTKAAKELSKDCDYVIGLSGTPITNRPVEFFNIINMVNDKVFPSWWKYTGRYCNRHNNGFGFGVDVTGASNTDELNKKLSRTVMIRRLKADVLPQLPPKVRSVVPISINNRRYNEVIEDIKTMLTGNPAEHLTIIEKAKQVVVDMKLNSCLDWIQNYIENDEKLVVFAEHHNVIEKVKKAFKNESVVVYGATNNDKRQQAVDSFQNDPNCKLFIGSRSAIEGLTLTAAKATCFLELWWTPGEHDQAEDRVHRIGQEADSVMAYYLLAAGTIEEDIAQLLDEKRAVLASVLDGKKVANVDMLSELLKRLN